MDIMSDRDPKFTSDFWPQVFKKLETTLSMSSTDHPPSDGQTERVNQIIEDMLRDTLVQNQQNGNVISQFWSLLITTPSIRRQDIVLLC